MAGPWTQFTPAQPAAPATGGPWEGYQAPAGQPGAAPAPPTTTPAPASTAPQAAQPASAPPDGPWSDYQPQQPATGRDALGGYLLPAAANPFDQFDVPAAAPVGTSAAAPTQATARNPFDQFDSAAPKRDALGGYLLPPQQPDPTQQQQPTTFLGKVGHAIDSGVRSVEQGATFGFGDEINAAEQAAEQPITGTSLGGVSSASSFGQRYNENLAAERARNADIPTAVAIPGQIVGAGATIAAEAPAMAARGLVAGARLIPGANALLDAGAAVVQPAVNALSGIRGVSAVAPVAKVVAEGAGYGAAQGFGDGEGGFDQRLQSAAIGAGTGAVLAPVVAGAGTLVGKGIKATGRLLSESGFGPKNALADVGGQPIVGSDNQPIVATPGVARVAGQQIADNTTDLPAAQAALANQPPEVLPGDRPTTFQVTQDYTTRSTLMARSR